MHLIFTHNERRFIFGQRSLYMSTKHCIGCFCLNALSLRCVPMETTTIGRNSLGYNSGNCAHGLLSLSRSCKDVEEPLLIEKSAPLVKNVLCKLVHLRICQSIFFITQR